MASNRASVPSGRQFACSTCVFVIVLCTFSFPAVAAEPENTCSSQTPILNLTVAGTAPVKFTCGNGVTHPYPKQANNAAPYKTCGSSACTNEVALNLPGATLQESDSAVTLTLKEPPQEARTIYMKCSAKASNEEHSRVVGEGHQTPPGESCTVQIAVWGPPIEGSTDYPTPSTCEDKETLNLEVNSSNKSVTFACGADETLLPALFDQVLTKEQCSDESPLSEHLSSASLVQHAFQKGTTDNNAKSAYTFRVTNLPAHEQTLCYKCTKKSGQEKGTPLDACTVLIKVAKKETDTESTTVSPCENSGAETGQWSAKMVALLVTIPVVLEKAF